jgi:hypothetical protein
MGGDFGAVPVFSAALTQGHGPAFRHAMGGGGRVEVGVDNGQAARTTHAVGHGPRPPAPQHPGGWRFFGGCESMVGI